MKNEVVYHFNVNGFEIDARFSSVSIEKLYLPILRRLSLLQAVYGKRMMVFLAGPPGVGKSTLAALLERLSREDPELTPLQAVGIDGFHLPNAVLLERGLLGKKGAPDTYNTAALLQKLRTLREQSDAEGLSDNFDRRQEAEKEWNAYRGFMARMIRKHLNKKEAKRIEKLQPEGPVVWPSYDRNKHEPDPENGTELKEKIILIEGNWLLLDEEPWALMREYGNYTIFIDGEEKLLKERLIARKMRGGKSRKEAEAFYEKTDGPNVRLVRAHSVPAKTNLKLKADGDYTE